MPLKGHLWLGRYGRSSAHVLIIFTITHCQRGALIVGPIVWGSVPKNSFRTSLDYKHDPVLLMISEMEN